MQNKCFIHVKIILILLAVYLHITRVRCNESCWNNANDCYIKSELYKSSEFRNGISMEIDCRLNLETSDHSEQQRNDFQISAINLLLPRFRGVQYVILDGCQTPLNSRTFGLELLPICANISKAVIRHFNMDNLKSLYCINNTQQLQLETLNIQFNEITFIDADSFPSSYTNLKNILLEKNLLKIIHKDAFKSIHLLEDLFIINEPMLVLKFPDLFEYSSISHIHLDTLKQMTSEIFNHLPETLENLYVTNTQIDNDTIFVRNSLVLKNLTIKACALKNFSLRDVHSTVKHIDLSGNVMKTFTAYENCLKELNLSNNQLESLPLKWLENLTKLENLILKGNQIKIVSLNDLLRVIPNGKYIDLSQNRLKYLQGYEDHIQDAQLSVVHLNCDQNPWDCLWLHEFAHYHPEKFRIFQYEKFISKINVNGLECMPAEKSLKAIANKTKIDSKINIDRIVNVSTYTLMYGSPWEIKRNQRAEALLIVFMLPLGIACLFVLLYMWIYCQKMFHLSYYENFPCIGRSSNRSPQRFDVIRQMPPKSNQTEPRKHLARIDDENEEGYETPINGLMSECNCMMQQNDDDAEQCQKTIHITYEHLPNDEPPHRVYEEILQIDCPIESSEDKCQKIYDHGLFK